MKRAILALLAISVTLELPFFNFKSMADESHTRSWYSENMLLQFRDDLKTLNNIPKDPISCKNTYTKLYTNDVLDIRIFFGYSNDEADPGKPASDLVSDSFFKLKFVELLTSPCEANLFACGFEQLNESLYSSQLIKNILGPDGKNKMILITLESSSVSESDYDNRHKLKFEQKSQSEHISKDFNNALTHADIVLYAGHSRVGTGPGFKPMRPLSLQGLSTWLFKPSRRSMLKTLQKSKKHPTLIGIFSCSSDRYYRKQIQKVAPETGAVVTEDSLIALEEDHGSMLGTLNSIVGQKCEEDFQKSLQHSLIYGFFKNQK